MKKSAIILLLSVAFFACKSSDHSNSNNTLIGKWQIIETLADPGDGSGTYQPTDGDRTITFLEDGSFKMNQDLCPGYVRSQSTATGTYNVKKSSLTVTGCRLQGQSEDYSLKFELDKGSLYLFFPCIEPCGEKYERVID